MIASLHHPGVAFRQACEFCLELPEKPVFLSVLGFQPDAHGVVGTAHDRRFAGAGNALDGVENVQIDIIGDVILVVPVIGGVNAGDHQKAAGFLADGVFLREGTDPFQRGFGIGKFGFLPGQCPTGLLKGGLEWTAVDLKHGLTGLDLSAFFIGFLFQKAFDAGADFHLMGAFRCADKFDVDGDIPRRHRHDGDGNALWGMRAVILFAASRKTGCQDDQ